MPGDLTCRTMLPLSPTSGAPTTDALSLGQLTDAEFWHKMPRLPATG
jgi:hypothetical protein